MERVRELRDEPCGFIALVASGRSGDDEPVRLNAAVQPMSAVIRQLTRTTVGRLRRVHPRMVVHDCIRMVERFLRPLFRQV